MKMILSIFSLLLFAFTSKGDLETTYSQLFPTGLAVLQPEKPIDGSNRIVLRPLVVVNRYGDLKDRYTLYEVVFANQQNVLNRNKTYAGREYAVHHSKIFIYDESNQRPLKYIISGDLKIILTNESSPLSRLRPAETTKEALVDLFSPCKSLALSK